jgi:hypothetical protein
MDQHRMKIITQFMTLLEEGNNDYKHGMYYKTYLNKLMDDDMLNNDVIVFILKTIYEEQGKCRYHTNNKIEKAYETIIIKEALSLLTKQENLNDLINKINTILNIKIEDQIIETYKQKFAISELTINYEEISEINFENIKDVYEKFNRIARIKEYGDLDNSYKNINDYLFCMYYFGCVWCKKKL